SAESKANAALDERTKALEDLRLSEAKIKAALEGEQRSAARHRVLLAQREWVDGNVGRVEELLRECAPQARHWEWHYLKWLCHTDLFTRMSPVGEVNRLALSPDGRRLAVAGTDAVARLGDVNFERPGPVLGGQGAAVSG